MVEVEGQERVVRLLRYAPTVLTNEAEIAEIVGGSVSRPRWFIPTSSRHTPSGTS